MEYKQGRNNTTLGLISLFLEPTKEADRERRDGARGLYLFSEMGKVYLISWERWRLEEVPQVHRLS
jgi:hypothetical protein